MKQAFRIVTNIGYGAQLGLRNLLLGLLFTAGAAQADEVVVVALGDSLTAGYGLPADAGFVPQLQAWLDRAGAQVSMVNAGVSGDTTSGGLSRVDWTLTPDVDAMIVSLGANDYLRALPPELTEENLRGILKASAAANVSVLLVGMDVGSNYGPDYKEQFDAVFPSLAEEFDVPMFPEWFVGLRNAPPPFTQYMQADGLHPNEAGVALIVETIGPAVLELVSSID